MRVDVICGRGLTNTQCGKKYACLLEFQHDSSLAQLTVFMDA